MDFKEFYHIGREVSDADVARLKAWKNIWPSESDFQEKILSLFSALEEHKVMIARAIAESLGLDDTFFTDMTDEGDILMRAIHYPASPPRDQVWAAAHTDIDLFTILPRATARGLQVLNREGEWIDVVTPENAFIINGGDMLENITNGEFHSGLHRVAAEDDGYERYSIVFFVHPRSSDRLDPLPDCVERTGGRQKYANATRLDLLAERLVDLGLASEEMKIHLAESGLVERLIELGRASPDAMVGLRDAGLASSEVLLELERLERPAE